MRWRAEVNKHLGVNSELVGPADIAEACPELDLSCGGPFPIVGALYHPPGAIARHDAVLKHAGSILRRFACFASKRGGSQNQVSGFPGGLMTSSSLARMGKVLSPHPTNRAQTDFLATALKKA